MSTNNETPLQRLERLRAEVAAHEAATAPLPTPGDKFHVLKTGINIHTGGNFLGCAHTSRAGETVVVTAAMIDASRNAAGWSWMSIIGDDEAQIQKWGEVRFRPGPAPADIQTWNSWGDPDWVEQREAARRDAWAQPTQEARAAALAAVNARFGPPPTTSTIISSTPDPSIKAAAEQRAALDAGGVRHVSHYEAQEPGIRGERR